MKDTHSLAGSNKITPVTLIATITLTSLLVINGQKAKNDGQPDVSQFPILDYEKNQLPQRVITKSARSITTATLHELVNLPIASSQRMIGR
ncbi:MAG TPA: hypothetical protein VGO68_12420 [Pyrinomonadaceae bacterium]|jgi:hypothetical protein|nr:hypothetical protein [Pyrinomonadaceae bacterium]